MLVLLGAAVIGTSEGKVSQIRWYICEWNSLIEHITEHILIWIHIECI